MAKAKDFLNLHFFSLALFFTQALMAQGYRAPAAAPPTRSFYDFEMATLAGPPLRFADWKGKVVLIVNTASKCGYTSQYKGLQALYEKYQGQGLVVVGIPSNDFGGQEPGTATEIKKFCETQFGVKLPLTQKVTVKGPQKHPVYQFLLEQSDKKGEVSWNFEKFLIDRRGRVVGRFLSSLEPENPNLQKQIEKLLQSGS